MYECVHVYICYHRETFMARCPLSCVELYRVRQTRQVPCLTCSCSFCLFVFLSFCLFVFLSFCLFVFLSYMEQVGPAGMALPQPFQRPTCALWLFNGHHRPNKQKTSATWNESEPESKPEIEAEGRKIFQPSQKGRCRTIPSFVKLQEQIKTQAINQDTEKKKTQGRQNKKSKESPFLKLNWKLSHCTLLVLSF